MLGHAVYATLLSNYEVFTEFHIMENVGFSHILINSQLI